MKIIERWVSNLGDENDSTQQKSKKAMNLCFSIVTVLILSGAVLILAYTSKLNRQPRILREEPTQLEVKELYKTQLRRYFDDKLELEGLKLAESNFQYSPSASAEMRQLQLQEYSRLNEEYSFDQFPTELPFCIIVQRLNILDGFSYQFTLNSIFNQNYSNYKAVILHEPDTKGFQMVQQYLTKHNIKKDNYIHIQNQAPKSILRAIYDATHEHCSQDSISIPLHRSGELIGKNVLKVYNVLYQVNKVGLIYSDYYRYSHNNYVKAGANYNLFQDQLRNIRRQVIFITDAITFRTNLYRTISKEELLGSGYTYYDIVYEEALIFPLVEVMCGFVFKIDGYYLLTKEPFQNYSDFLENIEMKKDLSEIFRNRAKLPCNQTYQNQAKGSFFTKSLNKKYLQDSQLTKIPTANTQEHAKVKRSDRMPSFSGNPRKPQTRKSDKYIYNGSTSIIEYKRQYQLRRFDYCEGLTQQENYLLAKYNLFLGSNVDQQQKQLEERYEVRLEKDHEVSLYSKYEVPLCIVIAELPSKAHEFRFQFLLNSIFSQNYSNYFVVINNRNPSLDKYVRKYLHNYKINPQKYVYAEHPPFSSPLQAVYQSLTEICHPDSIAMVLSGKQQLLGKKVFRLFSSKFRENKYSLLYSSGFNFNQEGRKVQYVISANYTKEQKKNNLYRISTKKYSHVVAFKTKMIHMVKKIDLQDSKSQFLQNNWDEALYFPLLELSCTFNAQIEGGHYLRLQDLAQNDRSLYDTGLKIRNLNKYPCFQEQNLNLQAQSQLPSTLTDQRVQRAGIMPVSSHQQLDLLKKNEKGSTIEEVLYGDKNVIRERQENQRKRQRAFEKISGNIGLELAMFNLKLDHSLSEIEKSLITEDYNEVKSIIGVELQRQQPMCIIADLHFTTPYRFENTLNSIFLQNYTNYFAVIFGDGSEMGDKLIRKYLDFYKIPLQKYTYLHNQQKKSKFQNIATAVSRYCSQDSMIISFTQSDEFVGRNVLKLLSWAYEQQSSWMVYSNYYSYDLEDLREVPTLVEQKQNSIRKGEVFRLSFAAFTSQLFRKIDASHFKSADDSYYEFAVDKALFLPMLELACAKMREIQGAHFIKTIDREPDIEKMKFEMKTFQTREAYDCLQNN